MRRGRLFLVAMALAVAAPTFVYAQPSPEPAPAPLEAATIQGDTSTAVMTPIAQAKAAQVKAAELFREGQFRAAADLLRVAYLGDARPILLFNAGQAYRKAEQALEAKTMYEQFVAAAPEHPLGPEARGYIKDMELLIGMQDRAKEVALALEEQIVATKTSEQQAARKLEAERQRSLQIAQALLQTQTQLERDRQKFAARRRGILGLAIGSPLVVAAVIGLTAGLVFRARASTDGGTAVIEK